MGLDFFRFLRSRNGRGSLERVDPATLVEAAQEYQIREMCFNACVGLIASAVGRCVVRTFVGRKETQGAEYYLWNIEPNANQSSTAFWHKAMYKLCAENEVLIVPTRKRKGADAIVVADSWERPLDYPAREREYRGVTVGEVQYDKTFCEGEVIHLQLNHRDTVPVVNALYQSYYKLYQTAVSAMSWSRGQHWKVHVDRMAQGDEDWQKQFTAYLQQQVKPFFAADGGILPEYDGYKFENVGATSGRYTTETTRDIRALIDDIMDFTAQGFRIPPVLIRGGVESTADARQRFLSDCIDPICDQLQEEICRKRYGFEAWSRGDYARVDSSCIEHFDLLGNASQVERLVGAGPFDINEILRSLGRETIDEPWANSHYMTLNFGPVDKDREKNDGKGGNDEA